MLTFERKKESSRSRSTARPPQRSHSATPSSSRAPEHAPSCACGGSCPRCAAQGQCAECEEEEKARAEGSVKPPAGTIGDGHDLLADRFSGNEILEGCFDNERVLQFGSNGEAVEILQQALIDAGFPLPQFGVDGLFRSETRGAVRDFQRSQGLDPDGIVGPLTMTALDALFATPGPAPVETLTSETIATQPADRTRTDIGVGEDVILTHSPGNAIWRTTAGTLLPRTGVNVIFTAPDTAQTVTVTAGRASIAFDVIAPDDVHMDPFAGTGVKHTQNAADSGIETVPFLLPDTVNFLNVTYRELNTGATVTNPGPYSCFRNFGHCRTRAGGACPPLAMTDTVVAGKGTQAFLNDCVYSGDCQQAPPFVAGAITFNIPYEYRVGRGRFRRFRVVTQVSALDADLTTLTSDKAGAHGDTTVAAGTVAIADCP